MTVRSSSYAGSVQHAIEYVNRFVTTAPEVALILGSGLGALADTVRNPVVVRTSSIPDYPLSTVPGHEGRLVSGELGGRNVVVIQGRVHMYEGYSPDEVVFPIRLVRAMGAGNLIVTNAAGGISTMLKPGSLMWITDLIDWTWGRRPVRDTHSRIRESSQYYDTTWMFKASEKARESGIETSKGTYLWVRGPSYETCAEIQAFKKLGADVVGMSTVPEVLEAHRLGMSVAGLSTVTNYAAGISDEMLDHNDVLEVGKRVRPDLEKLVLFLIQFAP